jgi:hypothetical protein
MFSPAELRTILERLPADQHAEFELRRDRTPHADVEAWLRQQGAHPADEPAAAEPAASAEPAPAKRPARSRPSRAAAVKPAASKAKAKA